MKLVRNRERFILELDGREYGLLREVLSLYPRIPPGYHQLNPTGDPAQTAADQRLLEEALRAQKEESRRQLEAWLRAIESPRQPDGLWQVAFSETDLDWFLQVLNDVRVGSWLRLGAPAEPHAVVLNEENWNDFVALEFCGYTQSVLLGSLGDPSGDEPGHQAIP
jgi:hypothetical protein